MKTINLRIRPIYHHNDKRIESHFFITMLAYYVEWYMREAFREITFSETELEDKKHRNPVAPAKKSKKTKEKCQTRQCGVDQELEVKSFESIIQDLGTVNQCTISIKPNPYAYPKVIFRTTQYSPLQRRALELIDKIHL
jgi:transposase